jgi:ABC-2 type transport system permease protein
VLRTVAGSSLSLTVIVIIALALGALPHKITGFAAYLPSNAAGALWGSPLNVTHLLGPWAGFAVLCGYAVVLTAAAAWRLRRRDA